MSAKLSKFDLSGGGGGCGWVIKRKVLKACVTLRGEVDVLPVWFVTIF